MNNRVAKKETDYYKFHFNYTAYMGNESTNSSMMVSQKKIINDGHLVVEVVLLMVEKMELHVPSVCQCMPNQSNLTRQQPSNIDALTHVASSCKVITELAAVEIRKTLRV